MDLLLHRGQWMHDSGSNICLQCKSTFSLLIRRHHCRRCGGLFCNSCSNNWLMIPEQVMITTTSSPFLGDSDHKVLNRCCSSCESFIKCLVRNGQNSSALETTATVDTSNPHANVVARSTFPASPTESPEFVESNDESAPSYRQVVQPPGALVASESQLSVPPLDHCQTALASLREITCEEWRSGTVGTGNHKMYTVVVPSSIPAARRFQVLLDNRIMTVVLPLDIVPHQRILVKAPSPPFLIHRAIASTILPPTKKVLK